MIPSIIPIPKGLFVALPPKAQSISLALRILYYSVDKVGDSILLPVGEYRLLGIAGRLTELEAHEVMESDGLFTAQQNLQYAITKQGLKVNEVVVLKKLQHGVAK